MQFDRESDAWVDVWELEDLTGGEPGETSTSRPSLPDPSGLEKAAALYRGPFMDGFSLRDSPPFEQWVLVTRERLQRQVMEALARLTALQEEGGEYERALATARRQLEIEPWQEGALQAAMRLLAHLGRRSAALAWRYSFIANSVWYQDLFGKPMAAVAASLPPDVVAAAQEHGRALDLQATVQELLQELETERVAPDGG